VYVLLSSNKRGSWSLQPLNHYTVDALPWLSYAFILAQAGRAGFSGNADVLVGIYIRADGNVGVSGKTRTPLKRAPEVGGAPLDRDHFSSRRDGSH